jgi:hypothetical protein
MQTLYGWRVLQVGEMLTCQIALVLTMHMNNCPVHPPALPTWTSAPSLPSLFDFKKLGVVVNIIPYF